MKLRIVRWTAQDMKPWTVWWIEQGMKQWTEQNEAADCVVDCTG